MSAVSPYAHHSACGRERNTGIAGMRPPTTKEIPICTRFSPRIDVRVFDHPQLVMHHGLMPSVTVGCKMAADTLQEWTGEPFVLVDDLKDEAA